MKKLKLAVAGSGRVGFSRHIQAPSEHANFEVIACMDKSNERLYEARDLYDLNIYDDFHKMVDGEKEADIIVIASPTHFHFEQAMY
ncbi:MAG: Gfo/Idh/MocA family oxidoreductase, partial [Clostridia bacterium]|nr:Gfo/Idh/MocA family oxidoreductase [Clostridia bacterium]